LEGGNPLSVARLLARDVRVSGEDGELIRQLTVDVSEADRHDLVLPVTGA
jgi:hypothetical protein